MIRMPTNTKCREPQSEPSTQIDSNGPKEVPEQQADKRRHPWRRVFRYCCGLFVFFFFILPLIFYVIAANFIGLPTGINPDKFINLSTSGLKPGHPVDLAPEIFLDSMPPNYTIKPRDQQAFLAAISSKLSVADQKQAIRLMSKIQAYYPEGYYLITKATVMNADLFKQMFEEYKNDDFSAADFLCHELSHLAFVESGYWIEDKHVILANDLSLRQKLFGGKALLAYISQPDLIDKTYLNESNQDLMTSLDEVNSYIKSMRMFRAFSSKEATGHNSHPSTLARQLYIISLHIKYAKEKDSRAWHALIGNKGFAYVLMRLTYMAEAEIAEAKKDGLRDTKMDANMKLYRDNQAALNEYMEQTGVASLHDSPLSLAELLEQGIDLKVKNP